MKSPKLLLTLLLFLSCSTAFAQRKPAPPASKYAYTFELDVKSLPKGVVARKATDGPVRYFLKNESDVPLVIDERFQNETLVGGTKLQNGKVFGYFPSGVPMEGKQHLKGWQAPFGDIEETLLNLNKEPAGIAAGREAGAPDEPPTPEAIAIPAKYDGKPYEIKGTIRYRLNEASKK